jgi:hypothetical protein
MPSVGPDGPFRASNSSGIARSRKGRCNGPMGGPSRRGASLVIGSAARRSAPSMRVSGPRRPFVRRTPLNACYGRNRWKALAARRSHRRPSRNASTAVMPSARRRSPAEEQVRLGRFDYSCVRETSFAYIPDEGTGIRFPQTQSAPPNFCKSSPCRVVRRI